MTAPPSRESRPRPASSSETTFSRRPAVQATVSGFSRAAGGLVRLIGPNRAGAIAGLVVRAGSRFVPENRLGMANLRAAFPEKSEAELKEILRGAWDNLARTVAELPVMRSIVLRDPDNPTLGLSDRIEVVGDESILQMRDDGKTGIAFLGHLGNWELLSPFISSYGVRPVALFRAPRNRRLIDRLASWRGDTAELVESQPGAALRVAAAMKTGTHFCMLMDQRIPTGPQVPFFGQLAPTNPIVARMARQFDCPVIGVRCIRLPEGRFRIEMTKPLDLPRDESGNIDVHGATAAITAVIESWVREHPDQWLWLHNRWGREE